MKKLFIFLCVQIFVYNMFAYTTKEHLNPDEDHQKPGKDGKLISTRRLYMTD